MSDKTKLIGSRIKIIRVTKRMQQQELAEKIGVSQAHMSNMESGRSAVTMENLLKLHEVLGCKISDFFVDIDEEKKEEPKKENLFSIEELAKALITMRR